MASINLSFVDCALHKSHTEEATEEGSVAEKETVEVKVVGREAWAY